MSLEVECRRRGRRIILDIDILRPAPAFDLTAVRVAALLDTGATSSGVARHVADQLALPSIGKEPVNTAGGTILADRYLFRVAFRSNAPLPFIFDDITGFELGHFASFQAVLGMDVLERCDVVILRDGRCTLRLG